MKQKRTIGSSDLQVTPFDLGANVFGWTADEKTSFEILDTYVDLGFNFIDTANNYSTWVPGNQGGESEAIIGKWLKKSGKRDQVVITTKVGSEMGDGRSGLKREYVIEQVEDSLRRLNTDHIDLYFTHFDDPTTPIAEVLETYDRLVKEGKVRHIGASNMSAERIEESIKLSRSNGWAEYICLQPEYNLYDRANYEQNYEPLAQKYNLGVVSYYSLASGFLTGKYRDKSDFGQSQRGGGIEKYINDRGSEILDVLQEIALEHDATLAQIALAWLLNRPSITAPIASVSKPAQLDILKSVNISLTKDNLFKLDEVSK